ncbi:MAG: VOC family protein [Phycisphaerae bacterium]|nr:VOC family protein [Gemmatimonadaceae bacterium]
MPEPTETSYARSASPAPQVTHAIPCLAYSDAHTAIKWLVDVFGAEARHVYDGPDGSVMHAEVWFGSCCVMMGSLKETPYPPNKPGETAIYIVASSAAEVDRLHEQANKHNARIAITLRDTDYGSHDFAVYDNEGNFWSFGTYAPV